MGSDLKIEIIALLMKLEYGANFNKHEKEQNGVRLDSVVIAIQVDRLRRCI